MVFKTKKCKGENFCNRKHSSKGVKKDREAKCQKTDIAFLRKLQSHNILGLGAGVVEGGGDPCIVLFDLFTIMRDF